MDPLSKVVISRSSLSQLTAQLSAQKALLKQIRQLLPPPLDTQLKAVVLQQGNLTLFVSSPVWASRLRYLLPQLQAQLKKCDIHPNRVRTSILPDATTKPVNHKKPDPPVLSRAAGLHIMETAKTITDPSLKAALERLGRHIEHS
jgi:hypothetical protein